MFKLLVVLAVVVLLFATFSDANANNIGDGADLIRQVECSFNNGKGAFGQPCEPLTINGQPVLIDFGSVSSK